MKYHAAMNTFEEEVDHWIKRVSSGLPERLNSKDLIDHGFYKNILCLRNSFSRGLGPKRVRVGGCFLYPKDDLLLWVKNRAMKVWPEWEVKG